MVDKDSIVQYPQQSTLQTKPELTTTASSKTLTFIQRFLHNQQIHTLLRDMERAGELIYRPKDILTTIHPLAKLIRMMFVDQRITTKYLEDMHHRFCESQGYTNEDINSDRNNFRKALAKDEPTFLFYEKVHSVFSAHIIDMSVTLMLKSGETVIYQRHRNYLHPGVQSVCVDDIKNMPELEYGTPIFHVRDIENTTHPIALFIHMFVVHQHISIEDFYTTFNTYYEHLGYTANRINAHRNNSVRQYFISKPTFKAWEKFNSVMGVSLLDMATTVRHKDGTVVTYALSDAKRMSMLPCAEDE